MFSIRSTFINKDIEFIPGEEFEESNTRKLEKNMLMKLIFFFRI